ncbi:OLC1v1002081C1 [Oldenlandia corymbosa var. corymbosa]|uniref:OLC1v1002081C1 n=1 Tax=Oldenlandia corymbosa var. corymbosa TaxID=529605 RepID=A0AAV1D6S7_OLDCO|nr:OLC1v1002081C1 [Oldenlandia corymbosa var. corymbosa]
MNGKPCVPIINDQIFPKFLQEITWYVGLNLGKINIKRFIDVDDMIDTAGTTAKERETMREIQKIGRGRSEGMKLRRIEPKIPCKHRKLILKYAHKYRLGLWRPRAEAVKS